MIKDIAAYYQAVKWVIFLQDLEKNFRISIDDQNKLQELMVAVQQYEDAHDAEVQAEYESMQKFEDHFTAY